MIKSKKVVFKLGFTSLHNKVPFLVQVEHISCFTCMYACCAVRQVLLRHCYNNTDSRKTHVSSVVAVYYPSVKWPSWRSWRRWTWVETCWRLCPPPSWIAEECTHSSPTPTPSRSFLRSCSWWRWKWASSNNTSLRTCTIYVFLCVLTSYSLLSVCGSEL